MARPAPIKPLELNRVIGGTFRVLARAGPAILLLALLLEWAPAAGQTILFQSFGDHAPGGRYGLVAMSMAWWLIFPLADMSAVAVALMVLSGRRVSIVGAIGLALRVYPVALGLDMLQNLVSLAEPWLLFGRQAAEIEMGSQVVQIVYGLASAAILLPSLGALGHERLGLGAALRRTAALSAGNRLRIAILSGLFLCGQLLIAPMLQSVVVLLLGPGQGTLLLSFLPNTLVFCFASPAQATLYWELARLRDGAAPGEIDEIFR